MTSKMQLFGLFICTQSALHVSGDVFAHHQEQVTVFTASDIVHLWDRRLYFPSEGRRAEDFYLPLKNLTASTGFEPANLGTKGQHATSRPPKPLVGITDNFTFQGMVR